MRPVELHDRVDIDSLIATPGVYIAQGDSPAYGQLWAAADRGEVELLGESYTPDGVKRIGVRAGGAARQNPPIPFANDYFTNEKKSYENWREKWWREAIQNASDAGATRIDCATEYLDDNGVTVDRDSATRVRVSCDDNGTGMDADTLLNKFIKAGVSGKRDSPSAVGGFGKAKELLLYAHIGWEVETKRDDAEVVLMTGNGNNYEIGDSSRTAHGTRVSAVMAIDDGTNELLGTNFIRKCLLPDVRFSMNGERIKAELQPGELIRELDNCNVYYNKRARIEGGRIFIRVRGMYMHERHVSSLEKGVVIVELTGNTLSLLTANRDGLQGWRMQQAIDDLVTELGADKRSALRKKGGKIRETYKGAGQFKVEAREVVNAIVNAMPTLTPSSSGELPAEAQNELISTMEELDGLAGVDQHGRPLELRTPADALRAMMEIKLKGVTESIMIAKRAAWQPDFFILSEDEDYRVSTKFRPEKMSPSLRKLARLWAELCRFVLIQLGYEGEYGVGWVFSQDASAMYSNYGDRHWLLLRPYRNGLDGDFIGTATQEDLDLLYAIAVHEATHLFNKISRHDEDFAAAFTYNVAKTANRGTLLRKIRKAVVARSASASGADDEAATPAKVASLTPEAFSELKIDDVVIARRTIVNDDYEDIAAEGDGAVVTVASNHVTYGQKYGTVCVRFGGTFGRTVCYEGNRGMAKAAEDFGVPAKEKKEKKAKDAPVENLTPEQVMALAVDDVVFARVAINGEVAPGERGKVTYSTHFSLAISFPSVEGGWVWYDGAEAKERARKELSLTPAKKEKKPKAPKKARDFSELWELLPKYSKIKFLEVVADAAGYPVAQPGETGEVNYVIQDPNEGVSIRVSISFAGNSMWVENDAALELPGRVRVLPKENPAACTDESHQAMKTNGRWSSLPYVGVQEGTSRSLELRNCTACNSTLGLKQNPPGDSEDRSREILRSTLMIAHTADTSDANDLIRDVAAQMIGVYYLGEDDWNALESMLESNTPSDLRRDVFYAAQQAGWEAVDANNLPYSLQRPPADWRFGDSIVRIHYVQPEELEEVEEVIANHLHLAVPSTVEARGFIAEIFETLLNEGIRSAPSATEVRRAATVASRRIESHRYDADGPVETWNWYGHLIPTSTRVHDYDAAAPIEGWFSGEISIRQALGLHEDDDGAEDALIRVIWNRMLASINESTNGEAPAYWRSMWSNDREEYARAVIDAALIYGDPIVRWTDAYRGAWVLQETLDSERVGRSMQGGLIIQAPRITRDASEHAIVVERMQVMDGMDGGEEAAPTPTGTFDFGDEDEIDGFDPNTSVRATLGIIAVGGGTVAESFVNWIWRYMVARHNNPADLWNEGGLRESFKHLTVDIALFIARLVPTGNGSRAWSLIVPLDAPPGTGAARAEAHAHIPAPRIMEDVAVYAYRMQGQMSADAIRAERVTPESRVIHEVLTAMGIPIGAPRSVELARAVIAEIGDRSIPEDRFLLAAIVTDSAINIATFEAGGYISDSSRWVVHRSSPGLPSGTLFNVSDPATLEGRCLPFIPDELHALARDRYWAIEDGATIRRTPDGELDACARDAEAVAARIAARAAEGGQQPAGRQSAARALSISQALGFNYGDRGRPEHRPFVDEVERRIIAVHGNVNIPELIADDDPLFLQIQDLAFQFAEYENVTMEWVIHSSIPGLDAGTRLSARHHDPFVAESVAEQSRLPEHRERNADTVARMARITDRTSRSGSARVSEAGGRPVGARTPEINMSEAFGQPAVVKAAEEAVAGKMNLLMHGGPPEYGSNAGPRVIGRRIATLIPPDGKGPTVTPHHTVSPTLLAGPVNDQSEVMQARGGVLFLEDFEKFSPEALRALANALKRMPRDQRPMVVAHTATLPLPRTISGIIDFGVTVQLSANPTREKAESSETIRARIMAPRPEPEDLTAARFGQLEFTPSSRGDVRERIANTYDELSLGDRVAARRKIIRPPSGHVAKGTLGTVIGKHPVRRGLKILFDSGEVVDYEDDTLPYLPGEIAPTTDSDERFSMLEMNPASSLASNPALINNPAWVTKMLSHAYEYMEQHVPAKWLPKLTGVKAQRGRQMAAKLNEYGCGVYGCVLPTLDSEVVLKVTTDSTEVEFARDLAGKLAREVTVKYHKVLPLIDTAPQGKRKIPKESYKRGKDEATLLWRDSADYVGKLFEYVEEQGRDGNKAEAAVSKQHKAAQQAWLKMVHGKPFKPQLAAWEKACRAMGAAVPELKQLAEDMITNLEQNGVFLGDVHSGNIGLVGGRRWLVVDPGNVVVLK